MSAATFLGCDDHPAVLHGYGSIPASVARTLATSPHAWLRRLITDPIDNRVLTIDSRRRRFDASLRDFVVARDQACRQPGCDAKIRHLDHLVWHAQGGTTCAANGQGLCERSNYCRDHFGWRVVGGHRQAVYWVTPTGHVYRSDPPPAGGPGTDSLAQLRRRLEAKHSVRRGRGRPPDDFVDTG